jgi:hypothetical protein
MSKFKYLYFSFCCFILTGISLIVSGQNNQKNDALNYLSSRGEVYFKFIADRDLIKTISKDISIDKVVGDTVFAYANSKEFERFLDINRSFQVLLPPSLIYAPHKMANTASELKKAWDSYPSYTAYIDLMNSYATNFPSLCSIHQIGTSAEGREILFVKISDNVSTKEAEPEFMYSSSMHGDELTGCILNLRLIDYMLNNYNSDPYIKRLVDSVEIWINPMSNPDGTYAGGNSSVSGAMRYNSNYVDLNRNFADPAEGQHPDGELWQPENVAMMNFFNSHNFVLSANYHGGAEVMNYPWDNFYRRHPDDLWFQHISLNYADTAKKYGGAGYFSDISVDGITNGYDWYAISGGRQDYMTYFFHGREITIEVSEVKLPLAADLPNYWNNNYSAMLHYIESCLYGINGIVSDSATHSPLRTRIEILGHDKDSSQIYSDSENGNYHRMLAPDTYSLKFTSPGYKSKTIDGVNVASYSSQIHLNVDLAEGEADPISLNNFDEPEIIYQITNDYLLQTIFPYSGNLDLMIYDINGRLQYHKSESIIAGLYELHLPFEMMQKGIYFCKIQFNNQIRTLKVSR